MKKLEEMLKEYEYESRRGKELAAALPEEASAEMIAEAQKHLDKADELTKQITEARNAAANIKAMRDRADEIAKWGSQSQGRKTQPGDGSPPAEKAATSDLRERVKDDPTGGFANMGDMLLAVASRAMTGAMDERLEPMAVMNQADGSAGGFTVARTHLSDIWDPMFADPMSLLSMCSALPIVGESVDLPALDESSRVDGSRDGGLLAYWKGEQESMTATDMKFRQIKLEPQELYCYVKVTNKLLRNSGTIEAFMNRKVPEALNFKINDAILNGTGVGMPKGILSSAALVSVLKKPGQAADTVVFENISGVKGQVLARSFPRGVWLINQEVSAQLDSMKMDVGTGGVPVYMPAGGISEAPYGRLYGRPVIVCEQCPALGDVGDVLFADLSAYLVAYKGLVDKQMSIHVDFETNKSVFRWIIELDGQPAVNAPLTPYKGAKNLSQFVAIAAR